MPDPTNTQPVARPGRWPNEIARVVTIARPCRDAAQLAAAWAAHCGNVLARLLSTVVKAVPATRANEPFPASLHCEFLLAGPTELLHLWADERLLRSIAIAQQRAMNLPIGAGTLSDVEQGMIEYLIVKLLGELAHDLPPNAPTLTAIRFDAADIATSDDARVFDVSVGGLAGSIRLDLPAALSQGGVLPIAWPASEEGRRIEVGVALPPVPLSATEWQSMEAEDVVTLGLGALEGQVVGLCTASGWALGHGRVIGDTAGMLSVEIIELSPRPFARPAGMAVLVLGGTTIDVADTMPGPGDRINFARRPADIELSNAAGEAWRCELVRYESELALRLLSPTNSPV